MATLLIHPEIARVMHDLIEAMLNGEFESGQLTLTDKRGVPVDILFENDAEVEDE